MAKNKSKKKLDVSGIPTERYYSITVDFMADINEDMEELLDECRKEMKREPDEDEFIWFLGDKVRDALRIDFCSHDSSIRISEESIDGNFIEDKT